MAFDFKKEFREFYLPKGKPEVVTVPEMNYIAVKGRGDPNQEGGAYQQAMGVLYAVAYTLKMSYKSDYHIEGFFEYVVPPLEGFWRQEGGGGIDYRNKDGFLWTSAIRLPDFVTRKDFSWASPGSTMRSTYPMLGGSRRRNGKPSSGTQSSELTALRNTRPVDRFYAVPFVLPLPTKTVSLTFRGGLERSLPAV